MLKISIANLILRGITLISKFILMIFIARYLSPEELGIWGLMNVTIGISLLLIGVDFYVYNTREILAVKPEQYVIYIKDQLVFHFIAYLFFLPLLLIVFFVDIISWNYAVWFYALLILEHISQESIRLLITLSRSTLSNIVLFFRNGAWIYVIVSLFYFDESTRTLPNIWLGWVFGVSVSIILSAISLRKLDWRKALSVPVNWSWIKNGLKVSSPFLVSTMAFIGIQNIDRYFLKFYWGEAHVGIYTFYINIANVIHTTLFAGIIMIIYPKLVYTFKQKKFEEYNKHMRKMSLSIIIGIILLVIPAILLLDPVLKLLGREIYVIHKDIFYIMLFSVAFLTLAYIPHYSLFVREHDKVLIYSAIIALIVGVILNMILVPQYELKGAAFATAGAMLTMTLIKFLWMYKIKRSSQ